MTMLFYKAQGDAECPYTEEDDYYCDYCNSPGALPGVDGKMCDQCYNERREYLAEIMNEEN